MNEKDRDFHGKCSPYVRETTKVSEIKDAFGKTRFKVVLTDYDQCGVSCQNDDLRVPDVAFQVTVVSYCYSEDALTIVSRDFDSYEDAVQFFDKTVRQYAYLAQAETRDAQDIRIYAERTGYRRICPDCCANCVWSRPCPEIQSCEERRRDCSKLICANSRLYEMPRHDIEPDAGQHDGCHKFNDGRFHVIDIQPVVDGDGICDSFERRPDGNRRRKR